MKFPPWLESLPEEEKPAARVRFLIKQAAMWAHPKGQVHVLSKMCGLASNTLYVAVDRGHVTPETAIAIEKVVGSDFISRTDFRPDLFVSE